MKLKRKGQSKAEQPGRGLWLADALMSGKSDGGLGRWPIVLLACLTWVLSLPLFAPWSFWPVAYIVFVPWLLAIALSERARWLYLISYLLGGAFYLMHFRWLYNTTPEGYLLCSLLYLAPLFVPAAWVVRHLHRERGWSLAIAFPLVWTAQELAHSRGPLAFPWFLLGHSQIKFLSMIQIADMVGVYGVSFVVAAVNGWLADVAIREFLKRKKQPAPDPRKLRMAAAFALGLVVLTFGYGQFRLRQAGPAEGPKVAVVQDDCLLATSKKVQELPDRVKRAKYMSLLDQALADSPDMVVLPETPWSMYLNAEAFDPDAIILPETHFLKDWTPAQRRAYGHRLVAESAADKSWFSRKAVDHRVQVVVGGMSLEANKEGPSASPPFYRYNSAFVFGPEGGEPGRYDKIHLVLFGEYVPFRYSWYRLYRFLNDGPWSPWGSGGREYSLTWGKEYRTFPQQAESLPDRGSCFGVTICYEDVIPQVFRRFILDGNGEKKAGFMLNISNDGWFGHGTQQAQHLVNCAFRAVENRVGIARSVNTGISGFIGPDGSRYGLVQQEGRRLHAGGSGYRTARVLTDPRVTVYSRIGDALPVAWTVVAIAALGDAARSGWRRRREARASKAGKRKDAKK